MVNNGKDGSFNEMAEFAPGAQRGTFIIEKLKKAVVKAAI